MSIMSSLTEVSGRDLQSMRTPKASALAITTHIGSVSKRGALGERFGDSEARLRASTLCVHQLKPRIVRRFVVEGHRLAAVLADPEGIDTKPRCDRSRNVTLRDLVAVRNANLIRG